MSRTERLVFGVFLVTVGTMWTLGNLGLMDALRALRLTWPAFLLLWGGLELAGAARQRRVRP